MTRKILLSAVTVLLSAAAWGQSSAIELRDTLKSSVKTDFRNRVHRLNEVSSGIEEIRGTASPLGEGDPIHWAQTLPGVTSGADGGSAMFVRGSNAGANLFTLDGVPVYGPSHILGLTTILPSAIIEDATLIKGGFGGTDGNFTASHMRITSKSVVADGMKASVSINNFLSEAGLEGHLGRKVSFIMNGRTSPLTHEYRLIRDMLPGTLGSLHDFKADVGDFYAKAMIDLNATGQLSTSLLYGNDLYSFGMSDDSHEKMGWNDLITMIRYNREGDKLSFDISASFNDYGSIQDERKTFNSSRQHIRLKSGLTEKMVSADFAARMGHRLRSGWGARLRHARFISGTGSASSYPVLLADFYGRVDYSIPGRFDLMAAARWNHYSCMKDGSHFRHTGPEIDFDAILHLGRSLHVEASFDRRYQYYHTLEGLPLGWSLDLIIPSLSAISPEMSTQVVLNTGYAVGKHHVSAGGFFKHMDNLVYYKYAQSLFSGSLNNWLTTVDTGKGQSFGSEFLYEFVSKDFESRIAYTWSKTNRFGFEGINEGQPFHARFDRAHVLNANIRWKAINAGITYQSGQWENAAAEDYIIHTANGDIEAEYFDGVNTFQMPDILRIDVSYRFSFKTGKVGHDINLGVYNLTSHFNPFMIYYDTDAQIWNEVAMLPIMPNFSYRITL